jgi:hypothetical protein
MVALNSAFDLHILVYYVRRVLINIVLVVLLLVQGAAAAAAGRGGQRQRRLVAVAARTTGCWEGGAEVGAGRAGPAAPPRQPQAAGAGAAAPPLTRRMHCARSGRPRRQDSRRRLGRLVRAPVFFGYCHLLHPLCNVMMMYKYVCSILPRYQHLSSCRSSCAVYPRCHFLFARFQALRQQGAHNVL